VLLRIRVLWGGLLQAGLSSRLLEEGKVRGRNLLPVQPWLHRGGLLPDWMMLFCIAKWSIWVMISFWAILVSITKYFLKYNERDIRVYWLLWWTNLTISWESWSQRVGTYKGEILWIEAHVACSRWDRLAILAKFVPWNSTRTETQNDGLEFC